MVRVPEHRFDDQRGRFTAFEQARQLDPIIRRQGLFTEDDDAVLAMQAKLDGTLAEALAHHAVTDNDEDSADVDDEW